MRLRIIVGREVAGRLASALLATMTAGGALIASPARADRIVLDNGRALEGAARVLPNGEVEIASSMGVLRIPSERVARIEESETAEQRIERSSKQAGTGAEELYRLAVEAESIGASTLGRRLLREAIGLDPDHRAARERLGYRFLDGRWVSDHEWRLSRGEVFFRGEWMLARERARILYLEALSAQIAQQRRLEAEQFARWREDQRPTRSAELPRGAGIPLSYLGSAGIQPAIPPAFVPLPAAPSGRATPPAIAPTRRTTAPPESASPKNVPAGRANQGRFLPGG